MLLPKAIDRKKYEHNSVRVSILACKYVLLVTMALHIGRSVSAVIAKNAIVCVLYSVNYRALVHVSGRVVGSPNRANFLVSVRIFHRCSTINLRFSFTGCLLLSNH